jgi:hypothetical protein
MDVQHAAPLQLEHSNEHPETRRDLLHVLADSTMEPTPLLGARLVPRIGRRLLYPTTELTRARVRAERAAVVDVPREHLCAGSRKR